MLEAKSKAAPCAGAGARPLVALADGTIDDQDAAASWDDRGTCRILKRRSERRGRARGGWPRAHGATSSYVDDVLEFASFAALPGTGETGKIYITQDNNKTWRWSGTAYAEISASLALGETPATAYRGDRGKAAYDHSQAAGNPHGTTAADVGALHPPRFPVQWMQRRSTAERLECTPGRSRLYQLLDRDHSWPAGFCASA